MKTRMVALAMTMALAGALALAADAPPLSQRLPGGTLVYVGWAGKSVTFDKSMFGQLLSEPAVGKLIAAARQAADKALAGQEEQTEVFKAAWGMASISWQRPCAIALVDVLKARHGPAPVGAVLIDLGSDREKFAAHLNSLLAVLPKEAITEATEGGLTYKVLKPHSDITVCFGYMDSVFFAAIGEKMPAQLLAVKDATSLASSRKFADAMKSVGGDAIQAAFFVDVAATEDKVDQLLADMGVKGGDWRSIANALGVGKVSMAAGTMRIVDRGVYTKAKIFSPAPHQGLLSLLAGGQISDADLAGVPADADVMLACKFSLNKLYTEARRVAAQIDKKADEQIATAMVAADALLGISIQKDILENLGDTWVFASAPSLGGDFTGSILTVPLKDGPALLAAITKIEAMAKARFARPMAKGSVDFEVVQNANGQTHVLSMPGLPVPVAPAWSVQKDKLSIALWPQVLEAAATTPAKRLTDDAGFKGARGKVSARPTMLAYVNVPQITRRMYGSFLALGTMGANLAGMAGTTIRPTWLPSLPAMEKYLWPQISAVSSEEDGIVVESHGSLPMPALAALPAAAPVLVAVLLPTLGHARTRAREAASMANLGAIGKALVMYAAIKDDKETAPDFNALIKENLVGPDAFISPLSGKDRASGVKTIDPAKIDYVYLRLEPLAPPGLINAYERPENHGNRGTIVLMSDSSVRQVTIEEFNKLLNKTHEHLAARKE